MIDITSDEVPELMAQLPRPVIEASWFRSRRYIISNGG